MSYTDFKKQAGFVGWVTDQLLGSNLPGIGFGSKAEYQRRQNTYNEIKNQANKDKTPYTVNNAISNNLTGAKPSTAPVDPNHVIGANAFNNERINSIQDAATRDAYMDFVMKGGAFAQQLKDTNYDPNKLNLNAIAANPNVANSIGAALENATPASLDSFIRLGEQYQQAKATGGTASGNGNGSQAASSMENVKDQLTSSFLKGVWKNVKANPIEMIPQLASMFLKHIGASDSIANFAANPMSFYLSVAGLLLGGGLLLSAGGGNQQQQQPIIINAGGGSYDPRMAQIPYSYR